METKETEQETGFKLEELLDRFPADVGARIILDAIKTAGDNRNRGYTGNIKIAGEAVDSLSSEILLQTLALLKGTKDERSAIEWIAKHEAMKRKDYAIIQKGAEMLENLASASGDYKSLDFAHAGELYSSGLLHEKSAECYEKAEWWGHAAREWECAGKFEKASLNYEKEKDFKNAAVMAVRYDIDRAIDMALKSDDKTLAPWIAAQKGRYKEALGYCGDDLELKAEIAELAREFSDAVAFFEQAGKYEKALNAACDEDSKERLYDVVIRQKIAENDFDSARKYASNHPDKKKGYGYKVDIELKRGDIFMATYYLKQAGDINRTKELLEPVLRESIAKGDFNTARQAAETLDDRKSAEEFGYLAAITMGKD